jgi:hypothetical protein
MNHHPHPGIFMGYLWDTVFMRFLYGISMELWNMSSILCYIHSNFPEIGGVNHSQTCHIGGINYSQSCHMVV